MADVAFLCVHQDLSIAEALADVFERGGFAVADDAAEDASVVVALVSRAALQSRAFLAAAERAQNAGNLIIADLDGDAPAHIDDAKVLDISGWDGEPESKAIDPLFLAVDRNVTAARLAVAPDEEVAVDEPAFAPPRVAARAGWRKPATSSIMRAVALVAIIGGGALMAGVTAGQAMNAATAELVSVTVAESARDAGAVRFADAAHEAVGGAFIDASPVQEMDIAGWRGLEPPSADSLNGSRQN